MKNTSPSVGTRGRELYIHKGLCGNIYQRGPLLGGRREQICSSPSFISFLSLPFISRFQRKTGENSVSLENQSKVGEHMIGGFGEDRTTSSEKTEQRHRRRQSNGVGDGTEAGLIDGVKKNLL
ncbi:hypothetical protein Bca4012_058866 [Brassica carinata]